MLMRTTEAAKWLGVSPSFLEKARVTGGGPAFIKLGRAVAYAEADLRAWTTERRVHSTSEKVA